MKALRYLLLAITLITILAWAQQPAATKAATPSSKPQAGNAQVGRGKYIVEELAKCGNCHTPRDEEGKIDRTQFLHGASTFFRPAARVPDWPIICPRIAGNPSATDEQLVTLLTTGIWKFGKPLRAPMPEFHMTREDAEAVVAYLRTLR